MNYWLLTTEYPPSHGGGISTYCYFTVRMLSEAGYAVTLFIQDDLVSDYAIVKQSEKVTLIKFNSNRSGLHQTLGYNARISYEFAIIVKLIAETYGKPDVIEAQDYLGIAYYLTQFKHLGYEFLIDVPILLTLHSPAFIYLEYNHVPVYRFPDFWTCEMEKQSIKAADILISPTHFLANEIRKYIDLDNKQIYVLPNPYLTETVLDIDTPLVKNKIICYGKLSRQKGSFKLLEYFEELWQEGFEHTLEIVGGTDIVYHPEKQTMGQLVQKKYSTYIKKGLLQLQGKIQPTEIKEQLSDAHVVIIPSIIDNLPYVVMEAMSMGKVVLASIQGGQKEIIRDGDTGFLFDHNERATFKIQLKRILSLSDEALSVIGKKAIKYIEEAFSFKTVLLQKEIFLDEWKKSRENRNYFPFLFQETFIDLPFYHSNSLSVVIPYYNLGNYIDECIASVLASSYQATEILVINDGSSDLASIAKLEKLENRYERVKVIHTKNRGLANARNEGAKIAKGKYLAFLDADDKIAPTYYEKAIKALEKNINVFFAGSWVQYFENSNQIWPTFTPQPPYALVHNQINSSGLVYKTAAFLRAGLNDQKLYFGLEDYESVINMMKQGYNGVVLPEILFYYRVRERSMFRNLNLEKLLYSNKYITEKHAVYYAKFAPEIINLLNANGPGHMFDNPTFPIEVRMILKKESWAFRKFKAFIKRNERLKRFALTVQKINSSK